MITPKTLDFLSENKANNSRQWFASHKDEYTKLVLDPLVALIAELAPTLEAIDKKIVTEPRVDRTISRIYRDMRRVRDGYFYRDEMWLSFKRDKLAFPRYPEFYFVMSPTGMFYGCGYYSAAGDTMRAMRKMILDSSPVFTAAKAAADSQKLLTLVGEDFKRSKYPDAPENIVPWLNKKNICLQHTARDAAELFSKDLGSIMAQAFLAVKPVYDFFISAELAAAEERNKNEQ